MITTGDCDVEVAMDFMRWWQSTARLMQVAPVVFGLAPFLTTATMSAQEATPAVSTACQDVIEHDVAAHTQLLLADCVTDETIYVSDGWTFDGGGNTIFAVDPPGGRLQAAVLTVHTGTGNVHDVVIDGSRLEAPCLIDGGATALGGLVFLDSTGEARRVTVRNIDRALPSGEDAFNNGLSQLESCGTGIAIIGEESRVTVTSSIVSNVGYTGVLVEHGAATISRNAISRADDTGVLALFGAYVRVTPGNQISYGRMGIMFEGEGTSGRIAGNTIVQMRESGVVIMDGAHASLADNLVTDVTRYGVLALRGAAVASERDEIARVEFALGALDGELGVTEPDISACTVGVLSLDGTTAEVTGGDVRECSYGLAAAEVGSRLVASDTIITGADRAGVTAEAGGHIEVDGLTVTESLDAVTVLGQSSAVVTSTRVEDTTEAALWVQAGGKARVSGMEITRPGTYGARVLGPGSALTMSNSTIIDAEDVGVQASAGAHFTGRDLRITGLATGLQFRDIDTVAGLSDVAVSRAELHLQIEEGAQATVTRLASTGGRSGVQVHGPGSRAVIRESSFAHITYDGVMISDGGWASVSTTQFTEIGENAIHVQETAPLFVTTVVTIGENGCSPHVITAPAGKRVRVTFHNATQAPWEIEGPVLTTREQIAPGRQLSLNLTGPEGNLAFSCFPTDSVDQGQTVLVRFLPAAQGGASALVTEPIMLHANAFSDGRNGINVSGNRSVIIKENTFSRLRGDGIVLTGGATATVRENVLADLGEAGILVEGGAQATVTANTITNPRTWGIRVHEAETSGTVTRNVVRDAGLAGIEVSHGARATLLQNDLPTNDTHGILVSGKGASAAVWQNTIGPVRTGITVTDNAVATVDRNTVEHVTGTGLVASDAQVIATGNAFVGSPVAADQANQPATGIHVMAGAVGTLCGNTVSGFLAEGSCGLTLEQSPAATLHVTDMRFPAPGNWRDTCTDAGLTATPVPLP
jgi:hypothetical protein